MMPALSGLLQPHEHFYPVISWDGPRNSSGDRRAIGRRTRGLCQQYGVADRMARPIISGDKRALNKRIVEALANQCYWMEPDNAPGQRVWACCKASGPWKTWQDVGLVCRRMGRKGLESIENVGPKITAVVDNLLRGVALRLDRGRYRTHNRSVVGPALS